MFAFLIQFRVFLKGVNVCLIVYMSNCVIYMVQPIPCGLVGLRARSTR